mgnify:CR=1 FL=1
MEKVHRVIPTIVTARNTSRLGKHLIENMKAKKGMNLLNEKGRIRDFERRTIKNRTEMSDWKNFMNKGKS